MTFALGCDHWSLCPRGYLSRICPTDHVAGAKARLTSQDSGRKVVSCDELMTKVYFYLYLTVEDVVR